MCYLHKLGPITLEAYRYTTAATMSFLLLCLLCTVCVVAAAELQPGYYSKTCPQAENIVRDVMKAARTREIKTTAAVMRFQFHDCFINGCDASFLLDDKPTMIGEKGAKENLNSLRFYEVIDEIKAALEKACPGIVSCADIVIMAARDAVALTGGPNWTVKLGRKDSLTASLGETNKILPNANINAKDAVNIFAEFGLSAKDLVALLGSHSIGKARCFTILDRLYNYSGSGTPDPDMDPILVATMQKRCPKGNFNNVTGGDLDSTVLVFDNQFYKDILAKKALIHSDQALLSYPETEKYVLEFSKDQNEFFKAFVEAMIKMGDLQSGKPGEVRRNCRRVNEKKNLIIEKS